MLLFYPFTLLTNYQCQQYDHAAIVPRLGSGYTEDTLFKLQTRSR